MVTFHSYKEAALQEEVPENVDLLNYGMPVIRTELQSAVLLQN